MAETTVKAKPDTIVLIHGFWVTPRSWEHWKKHYEAKGYTVLTPAYPGFEVEVEALRADPTPIEQLQVPEIIDMLENMIGKLDRPPIIIGHSAGGVFTQILLDHGFGAVGVAIDSAPTEGVKVVPLSEIKSGFPILKNPANRHRAVGFTPKQWHYVFANTFSEEKSLQPRRAKALRALPHPSLRQSLLGKRTREHPPREGRHLRRLPQRRATAVAVHLWEAGSSLPPEGGALECQALQVQDGDGDRGVRWPASAARHRWMGGSRRLRARLGAQARGDDGGRPRRSGRS